MLRKLLHCSLIIFGLALMLTTAAAWLHASALNWDGGELGFVQVVQPPRFPRIPYSLHHGVTWSRSNFRFGCWNSVSQAPQLARQGSWQFALRQHFGSSDPPDFATRFLGFTYDTAHWPGSPRYYRIGVPYWATLATGLLAFVGGFRSLRKHRVTPGLCPKCGYDNRATPDKCPECGTAQTHQITP